MNKFDFILLAVILLFTVIGAWRGLVREVISALTWVLAVLLAWLFASPLSVYFRKLVDDPALRQLLVFVLIFALVFAFGMVASWLAHKYMPNKRGFRMTNNALGGLVGAARGILIVVVVFLAAGMTSFPQRAWWHESSLSPYFESVAVHVAQYLPRDIARHIRYG